MTEYKGFIVRVLRPDAAAWIKKAVPPPCQAAIEAHCQSTWRDHRNDIQSRLTVDIGSAAYTVQAYCGLTSLDIDYGIIACRYGSVHTAPEGKFAADYTMHSKVVAAIIQIDPHRPLDTQMELLRI